MVLEQTEGNSFNQELNSANRLHFSISHCYSSLPTYSGFKYKVKTKRHNYYYCYIFPDSHILLLYKKELDRMVYFEVIY